MTDWKSRATEILGLHWAGPDAVAAAFTRAALQLGQEMQAETREILHEKILALEAKVEALEELRTKAADARAEEIARHADLVEQRAGMDGDGQERGERRAAAAIAWYARHGAKKKTREEVLEEALRKIGCSCGMTEKYRRPIDDIVHAFDCTYYVARRALEEAERLRSS